MCNDGQLIADWGINNASLGRFSHHGNVWWWWWRLTFILTWFIVVVDIIWFVNWTGWNQRITSVICSRYDLPLAAGLWWSPTQPLSYNLFDYDDYNHVVFECVTTETGLVVVVFTRPDHRPWNLSQLPTKRPRKSSPDADPVAAVTTRFLFSHIILSFFRFSLSLIFDLFLSNI